MQTEVMTPERWQSVKAILATALELDLDQRQQYVDAACAGNSSLGDAVARLLAADALAGDAFLAGPPVAFEDGATDADVDPWMGRRVGPYRIVEALGAGGMGVVYRATRVDEAYRAQVAIKIVREAPGAAFVTRFKTERQILARLAHPNIARLLDGGTAAGGTPYFVMELIDGTPITEFCERRALPIAARLELFLTVCAAVDYAHQHLVVHRDIKPGNILVTPDGVPKLLDFGIARILDAPAGDTTDLTLSGAWPMTPAYASPEQLRGEAITTVTDVYSLGLVLYELLTARRAFELTTTVPQEVARILLEREPDAPSAAVRRLPSAKLRRQLAGDLDTIVLKAIRKDPRDRYASVEQFAADIRRHLEGRPIATRGNTLRYRATKFVRRHAVGVGVAAAVLATVSAAGTVAVRSASLARTERIRAEQRVDDLRQLARSNLFELNDALQALPGSAPARNLLIERTLQYLDHVNENGAGSRDLQEELAAGYERIAQLQGNYRGPGIGDSRAAIRSYRKAIAIRESLVGARPSVAALTALGDLLTAYTATLQSVSRTADAARVARRALALREQVARLRPGDAHALRDEALAHARLAAVIGGTGSTGSTREIVAAIEHDRRALAILDTLPADARPQDAVEAVQMRLGFHLSKVRAFAESSQIFDALLSRDRTHPVLTPRDRSLAYNYRGLMLERAGDERGALASYESDLRLSRSLAAARPDNLEATIDVAIAQGDVGIATARLGRPAAALPQIEAAIEVGERLLAANPSELFYADLLVVAYSYQAETLSSLGRQSDAAARYQAALRMATRVARADPQDRESPLCIAKVHAALGVVLARDGRYAEAGHEIAAARADLRRLDQERGGDAEVAYVSQLNEANDAALRGCLDGHPWGADSLRLPGLVN